MGYIKTFIHLYVHALTHTLRYAHAHNAHIQSEMREERAMLDSHRNNATEQYVQLDKARLKLEQEQCRCVWVHSVCMHLCMDTCFRCTLWGYE